jgi:hypothetical protein
MIPVAMCAKELTAGLCVGVASFPAFCCLSDVLGGMRCQKQSRGGFKCLVRRSCFAVARWNLNPEFD